MPWGLFGFVGMVLFAIVPSPWIYHTLTRNIIYEFSVQLADNVPSRVSDIMTVQIDDDLKVYMGDAVFDIYFPELQRGDTWWELETIWRQKVRAAVRREFEKLPKASVIVIRVDPRVQFEVIAIVWTSIQAKSGTHLFLEVNGD